MLVHMDPPLSPLQAALIQDHIEPGGWDVCVATYEVIMLEKSTFKKFHYRYIAMTRPTA